MEARKYTINPTKLETERDQLLLGLFLSEANLAATPHSTCFQHSKTFPFRLKIDSPGAKKLTALGISLPYFISITNTLIRIKHQHSRTYVVYREKPLGAGCQGEVNLVIGKIKISEDGMASFECHDGTVNKHIHQWTNNEGRVAESNEQFLARAMNEHALLRRFPEYRVKELILFRSQATQHTAVIRMRRILGYDIEVMLRQDKNPSTMMPTDLRLHLTQKLALALKRLHKKNVIHRDFKHANVMFDTVTKQMIAIDLGLSTDKRIPNFVAAGTPLYSPPERLQANPKDLLLTTPLTEASDRYGLGWIAALLWRACDNQAEQWSEAYNISLNCVFIDLFQDISDDDLSPKHKALISTLIHGLVKATPSERCTLDTFIDGIEQVMLERVLANHMPSEQAAVKAAYRKGADLRRKLDRFDNMLEDNALRFEIYMRGLIKLYTQALKYVSDTDDCLEAFLLPLDSLFLRGSTSKYQVEEKVTQLITSYLANLDILIELYKKVNALLSHSTPVSAVDSLDRPVQWRELEKKIGNLICVNFLSMSLDDIVEHNKRYEKMIAKYNERVSQYAEKENEQASIASSSSQTTRSSCASMESGLRLFDQKAEPKSQANPTFDQNGFMQKKASI